MPNRSHSREPDGRPLALALVQVLEMWSNQRYEPFLIRSKPDRLTEEWFQWFVGSWKVARTIKEGRRESVRKYLDHEFRDALAAGGGAEVVDAAAEHIRRQRWSSTKRKDGQGALPVSLVSKVGFFLCSSRLVPIDRYALQGLNRLRSIEGKPSLKGKCYREYLEAFNEHYGRVEPRLRTALKESWVGALAGKLGCPPSALKTTAIRRKLFDDYLMHSGDYRR